MLGNLSSCSSCSSILATVFLVNLLNAGCLAKCYFPGELQGVWATQVAHSKPGQPIIYSSVKIEAESISTWGKCHSKVDENIIVAHTSRSSECFRCFRLVVASVNVASLLSNGLESCYPTVEAALDSCPTAQGVSAHIVLYKVRGDSGGFQETQCPLNGVFVFSFEKGDRRYRHRDRCEQTTSEMSNCRFGFAFNLQYRDCTFKQPDSARWHCLGSWKGLDGQKYLAVWDVNVDNDEKPKYKCGIYKEDRRSGKVYLSFSRDSTCTNELYSATDGFERYTLTPASAFPIPDQVRDSTCQFNPDVRGQWHNMNVKRNTIKFVDERSLRAYDMHCLEDTGIDGRYVVYSRQDCDKTFYTCVILQRRTTNIIEIMIGTQEKAIKADLCDDFRFGNFSQWVTLASKNPVKTQCPIVGSYEGKLRDSSKYCAQMFSDCSRSNIMYYAVDECKNHSAVFEQRSYQCLGEWGNSDGKIYALTRRRDINSYECFVGERRDGGVVYIMEAGSSCRRDGDPVELGMETLAKAECERQPSRTIERDTERVKKGGWHSAVSRSTRPPWVPSQETRNWKPITGRPRISKASALHFRMLLISLVAMVLFL